MRRQQRLQARATFPVSRIARVLRDQDLVAKLRATDSASAIYAFLTEEQASNAA